MTDSLQLATAFLLIFLSPSLLLSSPKDHSFTQEEIKSEISSMGVFTEVKNSLATFLSKHRVTGCAFALDPNIAFILDSQNPSYILKYKDDNGQVKSRLYNCQIHSVGFKAECALRLNLMFITDNDFTFESTNKTIFLSRGLEMHMPYVLGGISISYVSFINAPGGMFTVGMSFGPSASVASYIYGGCLKPAC